MQIVVASLEELLKRSVSVLPSLTRVFPTNVISLDFSGRAVKNVHHNFEKKMATTKTHNDAKNEQTDHLFLLNMQAAKPAWIY